jgi:hypothetical protein
MSAFIRIYPRYMPQKYKHMTLSACFQLVFSAATNRKHG